MGGCSQAGVCADPGKPVATMLCKADIGGWCDPYSGTGIELSKNLSAEA